MSWLVDLRENSEDYFLFFFSYTPRYDRPSLRLYITFFSSGGWQVQFVEADLKTPLPRRGLGNLGGSTDLEHAIETGRGGCYLRMTPEQYRKLRRPRATWSRSQKQTRADTKLSLFRRSKCRRLHRQQSHADGPTLKISLPLRRMRAS
jgi:hypothetical protein